MLENLPGARSRLRYRESDHRVVETIADRAHRWPNAGFLVTPANAIDVYGRKRPDPELTTAAVYIAGSR
jgi:hypothetical protein